MGYGSQPFVGDGKGQGETGQEHGGSVTPVNGQSEAPFSRGTAQVVAQAIRRKLAFLLAVILSISAVATATAECPCPTTITVKQIKPVAGYGYSWARATTDGQFQPVTWTAEGLDILPYSEDQPWIAYMRGRTGTYLVRATGACGVYGEAWIEHVQGVR